MLDLRKDKKIAQLVEKLRTHKPADGPLSVDGTWGSFARLLAAQIHTKLGRPVLYISPHIDDADDACDDLSVFLNRPVETFPVWEGEENTLEAADEIGAQRLRLVMDLGRREVAARPFVITTSIQALHQPVPRREELARSSLDLTAGGAIEPQHVVDWLVDHNFERVDSVDIPGQFAMRGGILDIFAPVAATGAGGSTSQPQAVRVEFFGDTIESIRGIDLDTQRSAVEIRSIRVVAPAPQEIFEKTELLINLLGPETIIILEEPAEIAEVSEVFFARIDDPRGLYPFAVIWKAIQNFTTLQISRFGAGEEDLHLDVTSVQEYEHKGRADWKDHHKILELLLERAADHQVWLYCENHAEIQRTREILKEIRPDLPGSFHLPLGCIKQGFFVRSLKSIVVTHHEIFGRTSVRRRVRSIRTASPIDSLLDLQKGDIVVHVAYGIGKYIGVETMQKGESFEEYVTLEYADKVKIHVPVSSIHLIHKFIGAMPKRPPLSKIGTKKWEQQKLRVARGVQELAADLLEIQARREKLGGYAYGPDTHWQGEFEESFPYQETPDQLVAAGEIKTDMAGEKPMDRLLCGDVGYGKTELAMRAAFKAVQAGKQIAVLVPTTVLCVQHGRTFTERFADFPVRIGVLNRFTAPREVKQILSEARRGTLDILIGTHRLLSGDVAFKDLGLLIIDEEQRFGVEHKERLKRFRLNVDILTMTATPIPRTLHMSLLGLRDISSLSTPPLDRRSVVTKVARWDPELIRRAINFELARDGQVFYLHNRVRTIEQAALGLRKILADPNIRIDIAHGRMHKHELEEAMIRFVTGQTQVLVCSTIIEAGLDIPNANTIIITEADRFGLAQLHQLRGRVGRYKHRAHAYMLLPQSRSVSPDAARRLKAIEEFSQLGAGFRIALRDLEIRGAGSILGPEQSGHIQTVGYELYCRMLADAVRRLKNEPVDQPPAAVIDLGVSATIPKSYIPSDRHRMDVYRRISVARNPVDLKRLHEELRDVFGPVPPQVGLLMDLAEIRLLADRWNIKSMIVQKPDVIFRFGESAGAADLFARAPGRIAIPDPRTVHMRLEKAYFEPATLLPVLRRLLSRGGR